MTRKLSDRDRAMIAMHGEVAVVQLIEQAKAAARAEAERLRERVAALEAALDVGDAKYHCGCPAVPSNEIQAFYPTHLVSLESPT